MDNVYYDLTDCTVYIQWGWSSPRALTRDEIAARVVGAIRNAVAAL